MHAPNAVINTANREMAATTASFWGASATSRQDEVEQVLPRPSRQKKVANMRIPIAEADSIGASAASAASAASTASATSRITSVNLMGLLDLNRGAPSPCLSPFSAASVPESVEFTETNPAAVVDKEAPVIQQEAPLDSVMPDAEGASQIEEISTGGNFARFMAQVCLFF